MLSTLIVENSTIVVDPKFTRSELQRKQVKHFDPLSSLQLTPLAFLSTFSDSLSTGNPGDSITIFTDRDFPDPSYSE